MRVLYVHIHLDTVHSPNDVTSRPIAKPNFPGHHQEQRARAGHIDIADDAVDGLALVLDGRRQREVAGNCFNANLARPAMHDERIFRPRRLGAPRRDHEFVGGRDEGHLLEGGRHVSQCMRACVRARDKKYGVGLRVASADEGRK